MNDDEPHLSKTEARGGSTNGVARVVLVVSLILVIAGFATILLFQFK